MVKKNDVDEEHREPLVGGEEESLLDSGEKLVRQAQRRILLRNVLISGLVFIILATGLTIANNLLVNKMANRLLWAEEEFKAISGPNTFLCQFQVDPGFLGGELSWSAYKIVEKKPVYSGHQRKQFGVNLFSSNVYGDFSPINIVDASAPPGTRQYNYLGQRELYFFHPGLNYDFRCNHLELLKEVAPNKLAELALSFDRSYTSHEVRKMLPEGITLNWYWVDTYSQADIKRKQKEGPSYCLGSRVYGIPGITWDGSSPQSGQDSEKQFAECINRGVHSKHAVYRSEYQRIFDLLRGDKPKVNPQDVRIIGVVVSGTVKELQQLENAHYINACLLGVVTEPL